MRSLAGAVGLAAVAVVTWWLWLGRDTQYQTDAVTGATSGPYEGWQVIGCAVCVGILAAGGGLILRPWLVVVALTLAFTGAWSVAAAGSDESGLWIVGAVLVFVGVAAGTAVMAFGARFVRDRAGLKQ